MKSAKLIIALVIAIILGIVGIIVFTNNRSANTAEDAELAKSASLSFTPGKISTINSSETYTSELQIDTDGVPITGAQILLAYDPQVLTNVTLTPSENNIFGDPTTFQVIQYKNDPTKGIITFTIAVNPSQKAVDGTGNLGTLSFQILETATAGETAINFLDDTIVTTTGIDTSILKSVSGLIISIE